MPYEWREGEAGGERRLLVWRHRSLGATGFVWVIGLTAAALALPLVGLIGSRVVWGLLPFALAAVLGLWWAMQMPYRKGGTREVLTLTRDMVHVRRSDPGRADRTWQANPHWVRAVLRPGPVENYLTISDGRREIELGAFLTPEERRALQADLSEALAALRTAPRG